MVNKEDLTIQKIKFYKVFYFIIIIKIIMNSGKDMYEKYKLTHWKNSFFKEFIILHICLLKRNQFYIVKNKYNGLVYATFQLKENSTNVVLQKLAVEPKYLGNGIGKYSLNFVENYAYEKNQKSVLLTVYDRSKHAIEFYQHLGYRIIGKNKTRKYNVLVMEK